MGKKRQGNESDSAGRKPVGRPRKRQRTSTGRSKKTLDLPRDESGGLVKAEFSQTNYEHDPISHHTRSGLIPKVDRTEEVTTDSNSGGSIVEVDKSFESEELSIKMVEYYARELEGDSFDAELEEWLPPRIKHRLAQKKGTRAATRKGPDVASKSKSTFYRNAAAIKGQSTLDAFLKKENSDHIPAPSSKNMWKEKPNPQWKWKSSVPKQDEDSRDAKSLSEGQMPQSEGENADKLPPCHSPI